ncbi:hypothetical protein [Pseudomonas viridiflava]|uniref:hypothetical protein n=1 Tax=Pseudomonas viridiflava TaxID=33069 RepID=UPI0020BE6D76|nr:hypothetical protein [Pseudomonas viridiflava]
MSKAKESKVISSDTTITLNLNNKTTTSVSMSFESFLIKSSKDRNTYADDWVESEIEKSSKYFKKEIYNN